VIWSNGWHLGEGEGEKLSVRIKNGRWHYRFQVNGRKVTGSTGLVATERNRKAAEEFEHEQHRQIQGEVEVLQRPEGFCEAAGSFIAWCFDVEYRRKPATAARIKSSFASAVAFFGDRRVSCIGAAEIEEYKTHRIRNHGVRDVSLRHDLHAISVFFRKYAIKFRLADRNPIREVSIPSDADAVRMYVISRDEEKRYFESGKVVGRDQNLHDVARLILLQGCRPEEVMGSQKEHYDPEARTLVIPHGKSRAARRTLELIDESCEILDRRLERPGLLFFFKALPGPVHYKAQQSAR
jgi:integrase